MVLMLPYRGVWIWHRDLSLFLKKNTHTITLQYKVESLKKDKNMIELTNLHINTILA